MSRARLRELVVLFAISSALTLAYFSLRSGCFRLRRLLRFLSRDFLGFSEFHILWYCGLGRQSLAVRSHEGEQCPARRNSPVFYTRQRHSGTAAREQFEDRHKTLARLPPVAAVASE